MLRERLGIERPSLAFPFGYCDRELVAVAREVGVCCASSAEPKPIRLAADPLAWGRLAVHEHDTATTLMFKLGGWYATARDAWRWLRRCWLPAQTRSSGPQSRHETVERVLP